MASPRPVISVLGSLNIDLVTYVPHHPAPGETLTASSFNVSTGGKGANQAVACAKLSRTSALTEPSVDVFMIGAVGSDTYGTVLLDSLTSYGVDTSAVSVVEGGSQGATTGSATIIVDEPTGQNRIIISPGANNSLRPTQFTSFPGSTPSLLVMQLEIPLETVLQALETAKTMQIPVLLNPAPAQQLPAQVYDGLAHLILNETETSFLTGFSEAELEDEAIVKTAGDQFLSRGVQNVVITLGGRGAYYVTKAGQSGFVPALKVDVVDTTAAGDTFIGAYSILVAQAAERPERFDIGSAVRRSIVASSKTVARRGAQVSIPWKDELE